MDPRTTVLIGSITSGLMAIVLGFLARATPLPVPGLRAWVAGAWLGFLALLLVGLRDRIPEVVSVILGNGALILAYICWLAGTHAHLGGRMKLWAWLVAWAAAVVALSWQGLGQEGFRARVAIVAGFCAVLGARHAQVLLQHPRASRNGRNGRAIGMALVAFLLLALAGVYGARGLHALLRPQGPLGVFSADAIQVLYTTGVTVCNLLLVIGFATMASDFVRARIEEQAIRDPLTGALNRRPLLEVLHHEVSRSQRTRHAFCVALLDIDHFKSINDRFGHPMGDRVLVHLCERVSRLVRPHDVFARYGGEEFVIVMPETSMPSGLRAAQRILGEVPNGKDPALPPITVSIGLTEWSADDAAPAALIERADAALYRAKTNGRNRVEAG